MNTDSSDHRDIPESWSTPFESTRIPTVLAGALALALILAGPRALDGQDRSGSSGWLPWAGCWEAVGDFGAAPSGGPGDAGTPGGRGDAGTSGGPGVAGTPNGPGDADIPEAGNSSRGAEGRRTVTCVRPTPDGLGARILTVEAGEDPGDPELLRADGQERSTSREGCEGWERAEFSADGARVYLETEYTCRGGVQRASTGIFSLVSPWEWLDVRSVESGGEVRTWTRRYQRLSPGDVEGTALEDWADVESELAVETARIARSGAPSLEDVVEASSHVHEQAVVAWLAEEGDPIPVDGRELLELAEAGVPGGVTDILVALSNPDRFVVGSGGAVEAEERFDGRRGYAYRPPRRVLGGTGVWGGWGPYRRGIGWGYRYDPFYHPWGYAGFGGVYGYTYRPALVYVQPRGSRDRGGQIVRGRGYTRPGSSGGDRSGVSRPSGSSSRGAPGARAPSRGSGDGGSVSSSGGYRGGSSSGSTGRTAVPRGDGDGDN